MSIGHSSTWISNAWLKISNDDKKLELVLEVGLLRDISLKLYKTI